MVVAEVIRPARERHVLDEAEGFEHVEPMPAETVQRLVDESAVERADERGTA